MRHVLTCGRRLQVASAAAVLFFVLSAGQALAVRTPAGAAPINSFTDPERWQGMVEGAVGGPSECDDDLSDPMNPIISTAICSSFFLEATQTGTIEVVVSPTTPEPEPSLAPDLNLFVFACDAPIERTSMLPDPNAPANPQAGCDTPVVLSATGPNPGQSNVGSAERVTFPAVAGVAYEVVTVPGFAFVSVTYDGCAAYNDQCLDPAPTEVPGPVPAADFLQDCGPDTTNSGRRHVTGGGYFRTENDKKQHFSTHVNRKDGKLKGVLNFNDEVKNSRYFSKHITCASFNDTDKTVNYKGTATKKVKDSNGRWQEIDYCFSARARDGGRKGGPADEFEVQFFPLDRGSNANNPGDDICNAAPLGAEEFGGPLYKGQVKYHLHGDDERCRDDD